MDARKLNFSLWTDPKNKWLLDEVKYRDIRFLPYDLEKDLMTYTRYLCYGCQSNIKLVADSYRISQDTYHIVSNPKKYLQEDEYVLCEACIRYRFRKVRKLVVLQNDKLYFTRTYLPERCVYNKKYNYLLPLGYFHKNSTLLWKRAKCPGKYDPYYKFHASLFDILFHNLKDKNL